VGRSPVLVSETTDLLIDRGPDVSARPSPFGEPEGRPEAFGAGRARWVLLAVFAVLSVAMLSTWGRADHASTGSLVWLSVPFDVVHLGSAAIWLSGLVMVLAVALPSGRAEGRAALTRFSQWALAAVVAIVATGVFAAWRQIGLSWGALTTTTYGRLVLYKAAGLVVLVALASISRTAVHGGLALPGRRRRSSRPAPAPDRVATPGAAPAPASDTAAAETGAADTAAAIASAGRPPSTASGTAAAPRRSPAAQPGVLSGWLFGRRAAGSGPPAPAGPRPVRGGLSRAPATAVDGTSTRRLRTAVALEIAVMVAVLAVTAFLVNARPAKQAYSAPFYAEVKAGPTLVDVVVDPAKAGPLTIHLYVLTAAGLVDNVPEVDATMSNRAAGISGLKVPLQVGGPGHFLTSGFDVPIAGTWTMRILVRTDNIDDYFADPILVHLR
jgi:copper transport protein